MKNLVFLELALLSTKERKAKKLTLDQHRVLIQGKNSTGKSSVVKSILRTFGADPQIVPSTWIDADVSSFVKFRVDSDEFFIMKHGRIYGVFDSNKRLLGNFEGVTKGLNTFLGELFDFRMILTDKKEKSVIPPPACFFMPFYIDQDTTWQKEWETFKGLQQFSRPKEAIAKYHTGIRPNEYYITRSEIDLIKNELKKIEDEIKTLKSVLKNLSDKLNQAQFNISLADFKDEIEDLLVECEELRQTENSVKTNLSKFYSYKITLETQVKITERSLIEYQKDFKYAVEDLEEEIFCPTCGTVHRNSFAERFAIAQDEQGCLHLLSQLRQELFEINDKITKEDEKFKQNTTELTKIESLLQNMQGEVKLKDVIESEGKKEVKSIFDSELERSNDLRIQRAGKLFTLEEKLKGLENKSRREVIMNVFRSRMREFYLALDLNVPQTTFKIDHSTKETGSRRPRALIAYYFSILHVMKNYTTSCYAPIVIDSPNQQAQDRENLTRILAFINENQPPDSQLILALEDNHDIDFKCQVIELTEKENLLHEDEYPDVYQSFLPMIDQSFFGQSELFF